MVGHVGIIQDILWADKHNNNSTRDDIHNLSCECELNAYLWMISTEFEQQTTLQNQKLISDLLMRSSFVKNFIM